MRASSSSGSGRSLMGCTGLLAALGAPTATLLGRWRWQPSPEHGFSPGIGRAYRARARGARTTLGVPRAGAGSERVVRRPAARPPLYQDRLPAATARDHVGDRAPPLRAHRVREIEAPRAERPPD